MSERYTIARITQDGERFEILVKPQLAFSYRLGRNTSISEVLVTDMVFTDAGKGLKASDEKLQQVFGTTDFNKIAHNILKLQLLKSFKDLISTDDR